MLEGEIREIQLVPRIVELWREQFTGAIRFENEGIIKIIYFKSGDILSASTNDRSDSIDEILMRAGKVSREHVKQALAKRKESETLGDALLNLGFITRKELTWARRVQVVGVIRSIAAWATGSFTIVADYLPKRDEGTLFPVPQVLVELVVTDQDRTTFERALDGGSAVFAKGADFEEVFRRLGLNEDAEAITAQIDGSRSAADVAAASGRDTFNAYKLLHALATLGILTRVDKPRVTPEFAMEDEFSSAGVADAAEILDATPPAPRFEFDEAEALRQPTLEVPRMSFDDVPAELPVRSAWDEPDDLPAPEPTVKTPMWSVPPQPAVAPAGESEGDSWGFDDAQLETSKKATMATPPRPPLSAPRRSDRRYGFLLTLMLLFILAAAGYYGWRWYQEKQDAEMAAVAPVRRAAPRVEPAASQPAPVVTDSATQPVGTPLTIAPSTASAAPVTTTTAPPPAATATAPPVTVTAAPAAVTATKIPARVSTPAVTPEQTSAQALPVVVPKQGSSRFQTMAREYAEHPRGKFTVQIQILCEASNLEKAISAGGTSVWFVPQTIGTRSCYRVFWGHYETREEAQRALASVPASLRDRTSAVKPVPKAQ